MTSYSRREKLPIENIYIYFKVFVCLGVEWLPESREEIVEEFHVLSYPAAGPQASYYLLEKFPCL